MSEVDVMTFEFNNSVLTPDAGNTTTIVISKDNLPLPFFDKSVAREYKESTNAIFFSYSNGYQVIVPYHNVRYILAPGNESVYKKETIKEPPFLDFAKSIRKANNK